jgi:CPA2 family monovalent cation:H+ antiporter-2
VLLTAAPVLAVTQPFLPGVPGAALLLAIAVALGVAAWRGAADLQGHVRAGAQVIVEALGRHSRGGAAPEADVLARMREVLPGLGEPVAVALEPGCAAIGRSLAALHLRGVTGATVLAIGRPDGGVLVPSAGEVLREGDVLALAGTAEAVRAAAALLAVPAPPAPAEATRVPAVDPPRA